MSLFKGINTITNGCVKRRKQEHWSRRVRAFSTVVVAGLFWLVDLWKSMSEHRHNCGCVKIISNEDWWTSLVSKIDGTWGTITLSKFSIPKIPIKIKKTILVNWVPRPKGFYKLNTDRADKGNPGLAGAGTIIRDAKGDIIATFFANMGFQTNNYA